MHIDLIEVIIKMVYTIQNQMIHLESWFSILMPKLEQMKSSWEQGMPYFLEI